MPDLELINFPVFRVLLNELSRFSSNLYCKFNWPEAGALILGRLPIPAGRENYSGRAIDKSRYALIIIIL